jgi:phage terminase large subunit
MFECTRVFHANHNSQAKIVINQGGTSSGKTYAIMQELFLRAITEKGVTITVTGESIPNLKKGAYRDSVNIYNSSKELQFYVKDWNKTDRVINFKNGSLIEFVSNLDEQSAKNGKRDYLFLNEAQGIAWNIFWQLAIRTKKRIFLDYNPTAPFWVHKKLIGTTPETNELSATVELLISDHRHNCFLSEDDHAKIEGIKDPELWRVYARGLTGKLKGSIFNFMNSEKVPEGIPFGFGIDIGYTSDKTAIVKVWYSGRDRYYKVLLYKSEQEIRDYLQANKIEMSVLQYMANILKDNGCTTSTWVFGDHDTSYANGLKKLMIPYRMAKKGPNSLVQSIGKTRECNNYIIDSPDLEKEIETYVWETGIDILTGDEITLNQPKDGMPDHAIAAIRYFNISYGMRVAGREDL